MSGETIQMPALIPSEYEQYITTMTDRTMLDRMINIIGVPKEYIAPKEFSGYVGSPQYWIDLRNALCKKNAIIWLEVADE